jgi:hypothetical protein
MVWYDRKEKDPELIVDSFNTFSENYTKSKLVSRHEWWSHFIFKWDFSRKFPTIKTILTTETVMKSMSYSFKEKKISLGYDGIARQISKVFASLLTHQLTSVVTDCLQGSSSIISMLQ